MTGVNLPLILSSMSNDQGKTSRPYFKRTQLDRMKVDNNNLVLNKFHKQLKTKTNN
jgi:hypothetical protein